jgi:hypothetical protein
MRATLGLAGLIIALSTEIGTTADPKYPERATMFRVQTTGITRNDPLLERPRAAKDEPAPIDALDILEIELGVSHAQLVEALENLFRQKKESPPQPDDESEPPVAEDPQPAPEVAAETQAPTIKIEGPAEIEVGHLVRVKIKHDGGPIRECELDWEPVIPPEDFWESPDKTEFHFTAPPGRYGLKILVIGRDKGYDSKTYTVVIKERPAPAAKPSPQAEQPASDPLKRLRQYAEQVKSANRAAELAHVSRAAHAAANLAPDEINTPERAVEAWANEAFRNLGLDGYKPWKIFFATKGDSRDERKSVISLFETAAKAPGYDPANLLDNLGLALEGKTAAP